MRDSGMAASIALATHAVWAEVSMVIGIRLPLSDTVEAFLVARHQVADIVRGSSIFSPSSLVTIEAKEFGFVTALCSVCLTTTETLPMKARTRRLPVHDWLVALATRYTGVGFP